MPKLRNKNKKEDEDNIEPALKTIEYRQRRGERLNYLIKKNTDQKDEEDEFWNNNAYFNQGNLQSDDESYEQKDNEKNDSFDSDFQDTSSSSENQQEQEEEDKSHKSTAKKHTSDTQQAKRKYINQAKTLYIHDVFKQEQLLREAVLTELSNKISLQYLIQIEEDKKKIKDEKVTLPPGPITRTISNKNGTTIQFLNYDEEEQLFGKSVAPQVKQKKFKYKDPQTQQKFNTVKEYKQMKRNNKLQDKINSLTKLLNS